jgi:hypothetical protein
MTLDALTLSLQGKTSVNIQGTELIIKGLNVNILRLMATPGR